jgi:hypothetical protein
MTDVGIELGARDDHRLGLGCPRGMADGDRGAVSGLGGGPLLVLGLVLATLVLAKGGV